MFVNLSNHPSMKWSRKQLEEAKKYGEIIDIDFPQIAPNLSEEELEKLVDQYEKKIAVLDEPVVMLQGEYVFTYRLVERLKEAGILVLASCTERKVFERCDEAGKVTKTAVFEFVGFRCY